MSTSTADHGFGAATAWWREAARRLCLDRQFTFWRDVLVAPSGPAADQAAPVAFRATLTRTGRVVSLDGDGPLLAQLERAGVSVRSRCRVGRCGTCACALADGAVEHLKTGAVMSSPGDEIRPCVTTPLSDLVLDL